KMVIFALPILGAIMFSGCATILGGGNQQTISINSDKPMKGKLVYEDGKGEQYFTTPATVNVDRRSKDCKNRAEPDTDVGVRPDAKTEFNRTVKRS
ncbi:hypothetical protein, partial [Aliarcobacter butzleri]|uniref:hypothetical protein n=1 Tax=Aliarcobacter butzleri TaxID=28197 RepID=UPI001865E66B